MFERIRSLLGLETSAEPEDEETDEGFGENEEHEERRTRVLTPPPARADIVMCRGTVCVGRKEALAEALRSGQMVIVDLRGMEREDGQSVLDFLCGVAFSMRGNVVRVSQAVFLALPKKSMMEEWEEKTSG